MKFIIFLLIVISVYSSWNFYFYIKLSRVMYFTKTSLQIMRYIIYFLILTPFLVRIVEKIGFLKAAKWMAYPNYMWMCFIFLFLASGLILDLFKLFNFRVSANLQFLFPLIISVSIIIYGFFEASHMNVKKLQIKTDKLPLKASPLKIVQISDLHLGLIVDEKRLKIITQKVIETDPDLLFCTGDLVDGDFFNGHFLSELLKGINTKYGKYAVTGNHEYYAGLNKSKNFFKKAGFKLLMDESITLPGIINIIGVNDPTHHEIKNEEKNSKIPYKNYSNSLYTILLKHRPELIDSFTGKIDLQLSGHTHKGQVFPFNFITYLFYPVKCGSLISDKNRLIYVSPGTGTWGPPVRFLARPEITVIELYNS